MIDLGGIHGWITSKRGDTKWITSKRGKNRVGSGVFMKIGIFGPHQVWRSMEISRGSGSFALSFKICLERDRPDLVRDGSGS